MSTNDNDDLKNSASITALNRPRDPNEAAAESLVRMAPSLARARRALFDSYVAAGFTQAQALELCVK